MVPMLGLGTYDLRGSKGAQSIAQAIELGYRHIDTAATYENEEFVGQGIKDSAAERGDLWVTTKVDRAHLSEANLIRSCEESLNKLDTEYVDLLLIHWPNREIPIEESLGAMAKLIEQGKARSIGVSNFIRPYLIEAVAASDLPIVANQVEYHPLLKQTGLLRCCEENEVLLTAYSPLAQGAVFEEPVLTELARSLGRSVSQICLRWLLQNGIAAIPKSSSPARMQENISAVDFELEDADMRRIEEITTRKRVIQWWPGEFEKDPEVFS